MSSVQTFDKVFQEKGFDLFIPLALPYAHTGSLSQSSSKPPNSSPLAAQEAVTAQGSRLTGARDTTCISRSKTLYS